MIWDDSGFLLSKNRYSENSLIVEIYTKQRGKVPGIIFGGTSKKIKNYLQIGNKFSLNFISKSDSKMGYFKVEIDQALSPFYFDNQNKLACITCAMSLIKLLNADYQKNIDIFHLIENFYIILKSKNWIKDYIFWELELFRKLGYDLNLLNLVDKMSVNENFQYVTKSNTNKKIVPNFLVEKNDKNEDLPTLLKGLKLVSDYLEKTILRPNNLSQPTSRLEFINILRN